MALWAEGLLLRAVLPPTPWAHLQGSQCVQTSQLQVHQDWWPECRPLAPRNRYVPRTWEVPRERRKEGMKNGSDLSPVMWS